MEPPRQMRREDQALCERLKVEYYVDEAGCTGKAVAAGRIGLHFCASMSQYDTICRRYFEYNAKRGISVTRSFL